MNEQARSTSEVIVIGAGPAGLATAVALAKAGVAVTVAAPRPTAQSLARDTRTFAALGGSVDFLKYLEVWPALTTDITPLEAIRLIDARGGFFRAPEVLFEARDLELEAFGYNIPQSALGRVLAQQAAICARLTWHETEAVTAVVCNNTDVGVTTKEGRDLTASLVVAADGRRSLCRDAAGISVTAWEYPQAAIACVFSHSRSHHNISTEFHSSAGPLTTVPMPDGPNGHRSSLVWVETPERAGTLISQPNDAFATSLSHGLQGLLGRITHVEPRAMFPLSGLEVETMARHRIALVGEAGHVLPPIGAQGLNLGLRDAATLVECIEAAQQTGNDFGSEEVLARYASLRARDVWTRTRAVDLLNRSLLSSVLPVDAMRGVGLHALAASATLRRAAMRQGLEPIGTRPRLMQPQPGL